MENLQILPFVLTQIHKRYCSIFFSKLVLLAEVSSNESDEENLRHYDIECEAVENISSLLSTKIKAVLFKSFFEIKNHKKNKNLKLKKLFQPSPINSRLTLTPRVMGMNRTAKPFSSMTYLLKDKRKERMQTSPSATNEFSDGDDDFNGMIQRLKKLNKRLFQKNPNNMQDPEVDQSRQKFQKRKIILQKIGQLETDINDMMVEDLRNHTRSSTSLELEQEIRLHENFVQQTNSLSNV